MDRERAAVARGLDRAGLGWDGWPESALTAPLDDRVRLSALLVLLGAGKDQVQGTPCTPVASHRSDGVIDRLRRRRLPWSPETVRLALESVMQLKVFDSLRVAAALRGAEVVCASGRADTALLEQLAAIGRWLDRFPIDLWAMPRTRLQLRRVLASAAPPDLLDLSLVCDGDRWGTPARELARNSDADSAAALIRGLGELGPSKASQKWLREIEQALRPAAAHDLLRAWLELAAYTPVVEPDETAAAFSGGMLFSSGNEDLVRAAVLATTILPARSWVPDTLGVLARRGAAGSGVPGKTASLSLKVASAAIDTLITRGTANDTDVLSELLLDLSRRDLVKRIGAALGRDDDAAARSEELRRDKAAAVSHKASPAPRQARAVADSLIRQHLGPCLRRNGFRASGRTWRRLQHDRVDVISFSSGDNHIHVSYGTRFDAAHPDDEPFPAVRQKVQSHHLDVRLSETWAALEASLDHCARHLDAQVVPFLNTLGRYELARSYLEHGTGTPHSAMDLGRPGSPHFQGVLGLLAYSVGDRDTAIDQLTHRVRFEEARAPTGQASADATEASYWRRQLSIADQLPRGDE